MKKIVLNIFWILLCSFASAQSFTGILTMEAENTDIGEKSSIKIYVKDSNCKMEISSSTSTGTNTYTLFCSKESSDIILISGGTRTTAAYSSLSKSKYMENILISTPTSTKQNVLGYDCTLVKMKSTNASIECMVATGLTINLPVTLQGGTIQSLKENGITGLPLEITVKDLSGKTVITQRITSIAEQDLNDSVFTN